ncbi:hypothetical protein ELI_3679 [Eubacterium callanderi]|uniref:Uncharacterized protein n=1 Tax=Eubacterium callanderi TaxID=53442 RepID=E3GPQ6_9FIRM|nr:hypothetical protein ELI_3679 [Eubacterium callanderi]
MKKAQLSGFSFVLALYVETAYTFFALLTMAQPYTDRNSHP